MRDFTKDSVRVRKALEIAKQFHAGQLDRCGVEYVRHPMRVASRVGDDEDAVIAALLHDTVEDTDYTLEDIRNEFGDEIADAVGHLTRRSGEAYMDYVARAAADPIAKKVKLADLRDNMDLSRFTQAGLPVSEEDKDRVLYKYLPALWYLIDDANEM